MLQKSSKVRGHDQILDGSVIDPSSDILPFRWSQAIHILRETSYVAEHLDSSGAYSVVFDNKNVFIGTPRRPLLGGETSTDEYASISCYRWTALTEEAFVLQNKIYSPFRNGMRHLFCRLAVIVLVCGLTVVASGDDVCLLRIAAPSLSMTDLPLDDPNTDLTFPTPQLELGEVSFATSLVTSAAASAFLDPRPDSDFSGHRDILRC